MGRSWPVTTMPTRSLPTCTTNQTARLLQHHSIVKRLSHGYSDPARSSMRPPYSLKVNRNTTSMARAAAAIPATIAYSATVWPLRLLKIRLISRAFLAGNAAVAIIRYPPTSLGPACHSCLCSGQLPILLQCCRNLTQTGWGTKHNRTAGMGHDSRHKWSGRRKTAP